MKYRQLCFVALLVVGLVLPALDFAHAVPQQESDDAVARGTVPAGAWRISLKHAFAGSKKISRRSIERAAMEIAADSSHKRPDLGSLAAAFQAPAVQKDHPDHAVTVDIAEKATDPSAILAQLQFQNESTSTDGKYSNSFIIQPVLPLGSSMVLRTTLPVVTTSADPRVTGLGDLTSLAPYMFQTSIATLGIGPMVVLPTATSDTTGAGKWQVGPVALAIFKFVPKTTFGVLGWYPITFAGDDDRPDVEKLFFQPFVVRHLSWGYIGSHDDPWVFDFVNHRTTIPVGFRVGTVLKRPIPWNIYVMPFWTYHEDSPNSWGLKVNVTPIFPGFSW